MSAAHTPGPWKVVAGQYGASSLAVSAGRCPLIAQAYEFDGYSHALENAPRPAEAEANARLIAAAPELADSATEMTQENLSDARALADKLLNDPHHSVTGTEAERIAHLLRYMVRCQRVASAALAKAGVK